MLAAGGADGPGVSEVFGGSAGVASNKLSVSCSEGIMSGGGGGGGGGASASSDIFSCFGRASPVSRRSSSVSIISACHIIKYVLST